MEGCGGLQRGEGGFGGRKGGRFNNEHCIHSIILCSQVHSA